LVSPGGGGVAMYMALGEGSWASNSYVVEGGIGIWEDISITATSRT